MPHRLICVAILLFWTVAAGALFTRDVLPNYLLGPPPDLRSIAQAGQTEGPVRWSILAVGEGSGANLRSVGQITTEVQKKRDGWVRMTSTASLDSGELLRGMAPDSPSGERIGVIGAYEIDASGNLQNFRVVVRGDESSRQEWLTVEGRLKKDAMEIISPQPPAAAQRHARRCRISRGGSSRIRDGAARPHPRVAGRPDVEEPGRQPPDRDRVEECFGPRSSGTEHDLLGQARRSLTLKVVTRMTPISAATWVRPDGLVLRQELPFPHKTRLVMERMPEDATRDRAAPRGFNGRRPAR